tara:strand:+ start:3665 stop:4912 length:1248 start_codon:yes stop_codon:yes gene_type:complete
MKILHLSYHENSGGAAIATNRIHKSLLKANVDSLMYVQNKQSDSEKVFTSGSKIEIFLDKLNMFCQRKLHKFNANVNSQKISKSYNILPTFKLKLIKKLNPDIVNLHWIGNNFINFKEISKIEKPIVWTLHDMWPYCGSEHYSFNERYINGYSKYNGSRRNKNFTFDFDKLVWLQKKKYLSFNLNFVATSKWQENNLKKSLLFKRSNSTIIHYPINSMEWKKKDKTISRVKLKLPVDKKILLFISERIDNPIKGFDFLKNVISDKYFKNFFLIILGRKNRELFNNLNIDFKFIEIINNKIENLIEIYSAADLLLAPSKIESFGIVAQEAACCSVPTVAFDKTGFEDTISHKQNGYIAKNSDVSDFLKGIKWCFEEENYNKICKKGREIAEEKFNEKKIAHEYVSFYKNLVQKNKD